MSGHRSAVVALLVPAALAMALAACGKRAALEPPKGERSAFTYPRAFPAPESVVPQADVKEPGIRPGDAREEQRRRPLSPIPSSDTRVRSRTY